MITKQPFGKTKNGENVDLYTLYNGVIKAEIITYGGAIRSIYVPDKNGNPVDVALGYDDVAGYETHGGYLGALIGRVGNRIREGEFTVNGVTYHAPLNEKHGSLHGGAVGFDKKVWKASVSGEKLVLTLVSPDGDQNYPGTLSVRVTYSLTAENGLKIEYEAVTDKDTPVSLTNHCYFNLNGQGSGDVKSTLMKIDADRITPMDEWLLTYGAFKNVNGTPFDFHTLKPIGDGLEDVSDEQIRIGKGYDINFALNGKGFRKVAESLGDKTGIKMDTYTSEPGVQFYAGCCMGDFSGKGGAEYHRFGAFCLETQNYPNAVNCDTYPDAVLKAGDQYVSATEYRFSTVK